MDFPSHHQAYKKKKNSYEGEDSFFFKKIIAETPVDNPGDEARNVGVLRTLAAG
jgi:hypothetical protein